MISSVPFIKILSSRPSLACLEKTILIIGAAAFLLTQLGADMPMNYRLSITAAIFNTFFAYFNIVNWVLVLINNLLHCFGEQDLESVLGVHYFLTLAVAPYASVLGSLEFEQVTGVYTVVKYVGEFGLTEWLALPLYLQIIYLNQWFMMVVLFVVGGWALVFRKFNNSVAPALDAPLVVISTVSLEESVDFMFATLDENIRSVVFRERPASVVLVAKLVLLLCGAAYVVLCVYGLSTCIHTSNSNHTDTNTWTKVYAITDCIFSISVLLQQALRFHNEFTWLLMYRLIFGLLASPVFYLLGLIAFSEYTQGMHVVQYVGAYGGMEWMQSLPLLVQIVYVEQWFLLVFYVVGGVGWFVVKPVLDLKARWWNKRVVALTPPLVAVSPFLRGRE
ncbi:hypothetical protein BDR26DRAFT_1004127 [Obelidium mucronatum]|nr:hypothetical protein BDR26DRAFT_1004127 [Obelidium mucronatum]